MGYLDVILGLFGVGPNVFTGGLGLIEGGVGVYLKLVCGVVLGWF